MSEENIPPSNLLRHADIAPKRKRDVSPTFYAPLSWQQYQQSFISSQLINMTQDEIKLFIE